MSGANHSCTRYYLGQVLSDRLLLLRPTFHRPTTSRPTVFQTIYYLGQALIIHPLKFWDTLWPMWRGGRGRPTQVWAAGEDSWKISNFLLVVLPFSFSNLHFDQRARIDASRQWLWSTKKYAILDQKYHKVWQSTTNDNFLAALAALCHCPPWSLTYLLTNTHWWC